MPRIYTVSDGNTDRLVRANTRAQAVAHVARQVFKSRVATQDDIVLAMQNGQIVEDVTAQSTEEPT